MTRRSFLATSFASFLTPASRASLREIAAAAGIPVGMQSERFLLGDENLACWTGQQFSWLTPGNELKWNRLRPAPDGWNFADADWMVEFARHSGMHIHGHNLCWNQALPTWFPQVVHAGNARDTLSAHINILMQRFAGTITSWDVVNEPVRARGDRSDGLTDGIWLRLLGEEYLDIAFDSAKAADAHALRVLNLDNLEQDSPFHEQTRSLTLQLLRRIVKRGVPLQAIGLESHLDLSLPARSPGLRRFIAEAQDLGLEVLISECDVNDTAIHADAGQRKLLAARHYFDFLTDLLPSCGIRRCTFWSSTDKNNWLDYMSAKNAAWKRSDGEPHFPGLLDAGMHPNPAFTQVALALQQSAAVRSLADESVLSSRQLLPQ